MEGFILTEDMRQVAKVLQDAAAAILKTAASLDDASVRATDDGAVESLMDDTRDVIDAAFEVTLKGIK